MTAIFAASANTISLKLSVLIKQIVALSRVVAEVKVLVGYGAIYERELESVLIPILFREK